MSEHFRKVALIEIFDQIAREPDALNVEHRGKACAQYYTGIQGIETGRWKVVGHSSVSRDDLEATKRLVGGNVYVGDNERGAASPEEEANLPNMDVKGVFLVEKLARRARSGVP